MRSPLQIVGRRAERRRLDELRRQTESGEPAAVLVVGDAGVGKSTLLAATADDARADGWQVQIGHCVELAGGALPLGPVAEVLRHVVGERGRAWPSAAVGPLACELDPLLEGTAPAEPRDRPGVLAAIVALLESLAAEQPTLLAVEDVHWADRSTLDALDLVVRTAAGAPLLVVATLRGDELHRRHPTRAWAAELSRSPRVSRIDLAPFGLDDLALLVERAHGHLPDPQLVVDLHRRTDGNAFFVETLLATAREGRDERLPERLSDALVDRLDALGADARRIVDVAAAAARGIDHRLLSSVAGLEPSRLRAAVREAMDAGVLVRTDDGTGYRLRHALLREVAHDELLPGEREELHRDLALALEAEPHLALSPTGPHGELAYHWTQARDHVRTYRTSLAAAREANAIAAPAEVLEHLERALSLHDALPEEARRGGPRRDRLLHDAGVAAFTASMRRGTTLLRAAADEARRVGAPVSDVLESLLRLAYAEWGSQRGDVAIAVAQEAVALVEDEGGALLVHALGELARLHGLTGRYALAEPIAERAVELSSGLDAPLAESVARNSRALVLVARGHRDRAVEELRTALQLARRAGDPVETSRAIVNLADVLVLARRVDEAEAVLEELLAGVGGAEGSSGHVVFARLNVAIGLLEELRIEEAARHVDAVRLTAQFGVVLQFALQARAALALHRGHLDEARRVTAHARAGLAQPLPDLQDAGPVIDLAIWAALLDGDPPAALEASRWLLDRADLWPGSPLHPTWQLGVRAAVAVAVDARARGDDGPAQEAAALAHRWVARGEAEAASRPVGVSPDWTARLRSTRAVCARLHGLDLDAWREALLVIEALPGLWRVQVAVEAATDLRAGGRRREALDVVERVAGDLRRLPDSHPLATAARQLREDLAAERTSAQVLTPREHEVLVLVAEGRTNREIGERLFVTEKTASVHVSNILRKLDAGNRAEAAAVARRRGLL